MAGLNPGTKSSRHRIMSADGTFDGRGAKILVRLTHEEKAAIEVVAKRQGLGLAEWARKQMFAALTMEDLHAGRRAVHQPKGVSDVLR